MRAAAARPGATLRGVGAGLRPTQWLYLGLALVLSAGLSYAAYARLTTPAPREVQTVPAVRGPIQASVSSAGTVVADTSTKLNFLVSGRVASVAVKVGDRVEAGQVLAQLDTDELELQYRQAQA